MLNPSSISPWSIAVTPYLLPWHVSAISAFMLFFFLPLPLPQVSCLSSASSHSSVVCHPCKIIATSNFYSTHLSCLWPSCWHSSISSCCFISFCLIPVGSCKQVVCTSSLSYQEGFLPQCQHGLVMYLIVSTLSILWASDDSATTCLTD